MPSGTTYVTIFPPLCLRELYSRPDSVTYGLSCYATAFTDIGDRELPEDNVRSLLARVEDGASR